MVYLHQRVGDKEDHIDMEICIENDRGFSYRRGQLGDITRILL